MSKLDVYHLQIVAHYFKLKSDFLNVIQLRKQYQYLLDRFRINPIPITEDTKNLFQYLDTQQIFNEQSLNKKNQIKRKEYEILLPNIKRIQYNCEVNYFQYLDIMIDTKI